jgi:beta-N-acetylhexosaminidase
MNLDLPVEPEPAAPESSPSPPALAGIRFLRSFDGREPSSGILEAIGAGRASGVTLFRARNVDSPQQVRELCASLQAARPAGDLPLIIGLDQEGGQLQAVGDPATAWPGNLALGATGSEELARRAGRAIGLEVAAVGGTLVYAPVCDVLHRASATPLGTRPFGDDPAVVARLAGAMTEGLQSAGVAATLKHFPGHGAAGADSHRALPVIDHDLETLRTEELPPFRAAIAAGASAVMAGHIGVPALTGGVTMPATVSREILGDLLRRDLGFEGVTVSDALDMAGAAYGDGLGGVVGEAAAAGMDLLLLNHPPAVEQAAFESVLAAIAAGRLEPRGSLAARDRILRLRRHLAGLVQPPLEIVGCAEHRRLARRIAEASITLVRDPKGILPIEPGAGRIAVLAPAPADLTPAETSSYVPMGLARTLRTRGFDVEELVTPLDPSDAEVAALATAAAGCQVAVVGTFDAVSFAGQARLVTRLAAVKALVAVALRSPYDVELYPASVATVATYGIEPPQIEALADALSGRIPFAGRLPVRLEARP